MKLMTEIMLDAGCWMLDASLVSVVCAEAEPRHGFQIPTECF